jgi:hypothetical protein
MNKDNIIIEEKNSVITPEATQEALECLPHNYVVKAIAVLEKWKEEGIIDKSYSSRYVIKVRKGDKGAFNEDIMKALIEVGTENKTIQEKYGRPTKKASPSN